MRPITESWLYSLAYCVFALMVLVVTSVMYEPLHQSFSINYMQMAWLVSAFGYTYIFMQLPAGWVMDRLGATVLLRVVVVVTALGCIWAAMARSYNELLLARAFTGIGCSAAIPAALYISSNGFSPKRFVLLVGLIETAAALAAGIGEPLFAYLLNSYSWREVMFGLSGVGALLAVLMFWRLPSRRMLYTADASPHMPPVDTDTNDKTVTLAAGPQPSYTFKQRWRVLTSGTVLLNGIIAGVLFAVVMNFGGLWSIPFLQQDYGLAHQHAALVSGFSLIGAAVGAPLIGYIATTEHRQFPMMFAGSITASALLVLLINGVVPEAILTPFMFVLGVSTSVYVIPYAIAKHNTPAGMSGSVMSVVNLITGGLGALLMVPVIGYLVDGAAGPHWYLTAAVRLFPLSLLFICFILIIFDDEMRRSLVHI